MKSFRFNSEGSVSYSSGEAGGKLQETGEKNPDAEIRTLELAFDFSDLTSLMIQKYNSICCSDYSSSCCVSSLYASGNQVLF